MCDGVECYRRIDAKTGGCQLDLIVVSELLANEEVRRQHCITRASWDRL